MEKFDKTDGDREAKFNQTLNDSIDSLVGNTSSLVESLPLIMFMLGATHKKNVQNLERFIKEKNIKRFKRKDGDYLRLKDKDLLAFEPLEKRVADTGVAGIIIPKNFIVSLVSQFDIFLGRLIKAMFFLRPELLRLGENSVTLLKLLEFSSLEEVQNHFVDEQVDNVLRKSRPDQIRWLEQYINTPIIDLLTSWATFVEVCERRNLFVHTDGKVSDQYLKVCKEEKINVSDVHLNDELGVDSKYFENAYFSIIGTGLEIGFVLRRKFLPKNLLSAEAKLVNVTYSLLDSKKYDLAASLLSFALDKFDNHSNQEVKLIMQINKILSLKKANKSNDVKNLIEGIDWSALNLNFVIAKEILLENYDKAAELMIRIGPRDPELDESAYQNWPLFSDFRKTKIFRDSYKKVFKKKFEMKQEPKPLIGEFLEEAKKYGPSKRH